MKIYLDLFFIINCAMNFMILAIMQIHSRRKIRSIRIFAATILSGIASVFCLLVHNLIIKISGGLILIYLSIRIMWPYLCVAAKIKKIFYFIFVSIVLSGAATLFLNVFQPGLRSGIFILMEPLILFFYQKYKRWNDKKLPSTNEYEVRISLRKGNCIKQGIGFLDTGNHLVEPISGNGVSIVSYSFFESFMQGEKEKWNTILFSEKPELFGDLPLRYIPYHSIGKNSYLYGIQMDELIIHSKNQDKRIDNIWIAISTDVLSGHSEYDMILHPALFRV